MIFIRSYYESLWGGLERKLRISRLWRQKNHNKGVKTEVSFLVKTWFGGSEMGFNKVQLWVSNFAIGVVKIKSSVLSLLTFSL